MHLILPSNACVEHFPDNGPALFSINLPDTLHFPNHEVGLIRIYYGKEFFTLEAPRIRVFVTPTEFVEQALIQVPANIASTADFLKKFSARFSTTITQDFLFSVEGTQLQFRSISPGKFVLKFPPKCIQMYSLYKEGSETLVTEEVEFGPLEKFSIDVRIAAPVEESFSGDLMYKRLDEAILENPKISKGYYESGELIVKEMNETVWKALKRHFPRGTPPISGPFSFKQSSNRCRYIKVASVKSIKLDPTVARTLGFRNEELMGEQEAPFPVDFTNGIQTMYIYSSIVEPVIVGDVKVPLLGAVPFERKLQGEREIYEYVTPTYHPIVKYPFKTIEVQLSDDMGNSLKSVMRGKTVLCVHIRECK